MLYAPGEVREDSVLLDAVSAEVQVVDGRRRLLGLFQRHPAAPVSPSLPLWMQVVSAVVTWLGAISVILAVLTFRLSGPWIRLRGEVDAENQIRLIATNHGRIAGYIYLLGVGTPRRAGLRLRPNAAIPVKPEIVIPGFQATDLKAGEIKVWEATWPAGGVEADRRTLSSKVVKTRKVEPGSRAAWVYATVNGKLRTDGSPTPRTRSSPRRRGRVVDGRVEPSGAYGRLSRLCIPSSSPMT